MTEDEFAALPPGEVDAGWKETDRAWQNERRSEFRNVIDLDRNGKVTRDELKVHVTGCHVYGKVMGGNLELRKFLKFLEKA